jgi:hypothetical protein
VTRFPKCSARCRWASRALPHGNGYGLLRKSSPRVSQVPHNTTCRPSCARLCSSAWLPPVRSPCGCFAFRVLRAGGGAPAAPVPPSPSPRSPLPRNRKPTPTLTPRIVLSARLLLAARGPCAAVWCRACLCRHAASQRRPSATKARQQGVRVLLAGAAGSAWWSWDNCGQTTDRLLTNYVTFTAAPGVAAGANGSLFLTVCAWGHAGLHRHSTLHLGCCAEGPPGEDAAHLPATRLNACVVYFVFTGLNRLARAAGVRRMADQGVRGTPVGAGTTDPQAQPPPRNTPTPTSTTPPPPRPSHPPPRRGLAGDSGFGGLHRLCTFSSRLPQRPCPTPTPSALPCTPDLRACHPPRPAFAAGRSHLRLHRRG